MKTELVSLYNDTYIALVYNDTYITSLYNDTYIASSKDSRRSSLDLNFKAIKRMCGDKNNKLLRAEMKSVERFLPRASESLRKAAGYQIDRLSANYYCCSQKKISS